MGAPSPSWSRRKSAGPSDLAARPTRPKRSRRPSPPQKRRLRESLHPSRQPASSAVPARLKQLSEEEKGARAKALADARVRDAEERERAKEDAAKEAALAEQRAKEAAEAEAREREEAAQKAAEAEAEAKAKPKAAPSAEAPRRPMEPDQEGPKRQPMPGIRKPRRHRAVAKSAAFADASRLPTHSTKSSGSGALPR
ncbi:hypothetical protein [Methyloceanibacter stevinii]|uniref:hypothetical protein n=1 Tax=Methyloceanibacter stevinii TaxID=1774970 RepID=UPI001FCDCAA2|nr:hypothetical protein [Methyloceanibacter stevinii]